MDGIKAAKSAEFVDQSSVGGLVGSESGEIGGGPSEGLESLSW